MKSSLISKARLELRNLENRIAPATFVNPNSITYEDVDGDSVTVTISKPVLTADNVDSIFTFDTGGFGDANAASQSLEIIRLTDLAVTGGTVSVLARKVDNTPSTADVGFVNAEGIDLLSVTISGDLGKILAGDDALKTPGLGKLSAGSLGVRGAAPGNDLSSEIKGTLGVLELKGDIKEARVHVAGNLGALSVAGSIAPTSTLPRAASVIADGDIGSVTIGGDLIGGSGVQSGSIIANGSVVERTRLIKVRDPGDGSINLYPVTFGYRLVGGNLGPVTIGGTVRGGIGAQSGAIGSVIGSLKSVKITGDLLGGTGNQSGSVFALSDTQTLSVGDADSSVEVPVVLGGNIGAVTVGGSVTGAIGIQSGAIVAELGSIQSVKIGGDLIGAGGEESGAISVEGSTKPSARTRRWSRTVHDYGYTQTYHYSETSITGYKLLGGTIGSVDIGGKVEGSTGIHSGSIGSLLGSVGTVSIKGDLTGGGGPESGAVFAKSTTEQLGEGDGPEIVLGGNVGAVAIGGSMAGGGGLASGSITADQGSIGSVQIKGNLTGGTVDDTGSILATGVARARIKVRITKMDGETSKENVVVGYQLVGGNLGPVTIGGTVRGGIGAQSGAIGSVIGSLKSVKITGDLLGGTGNQSGSVFALSDTQTLSVGDADSSVEVPVVLGGNIGAVTVGGSVTGAIGIQSGAIVAELGSIQSVKIGGDLIGAGGEESGAISVEGSTKPSARTRRWSRTTHEYGYSQTYHYSETSITGYKLLGGTIGSVDIGGKVEGSTGIHSGSIGSLLGSVGTVSIKGDLTGGGGPESGAVFAKSTTEQLGEGDGPEIVLGGNVGAVAIGGSMAGGGGLASGSITADQGSIGSVQIKGNMTGGTVDDTGSILATGVARAKTQVNFSKVDGNTIVVVGYNLVGGNIQSVVIGGNVQGGAGNFSGAIGSTIGTIGAVTITGNRKLGVTGNLEGGSGLESGAIFATADVQQTTGHRDVAIGGKIGMVNIAGSVLGAAGLNSASILADLAVDAISVGGDWSGANIIVGKDAGADKLIDTNDDELSVPFVPDSTNKIGSIVIKGQLAGAATQTTGPFRFTAQMIGSLTVGGKTAKLANGARNDVIDLTSEFRLVEFAPP